VPAFVLGQLADAGDQRVAVFTGHREVRDEHVRPELAHEGETLRRRAHAARLGAVQREDQAHRVERVGVVVHEEDAQAVEAFAGHASG
jgi:hypothetical protein